MDTLTRCSRCAIKAFITASVVTILLFVLKVKPLWAYVAGAVVLIMLLPVEYEGEEVMR